MAAYRRYVCVTRDVWWHNALWQVGDTLDYDKKPPDHFIPFDKGDLSLIDYAQKYFDMDLDQNLSTYEKVEEIAEKINEDRFAFIS